VETDPTVMCELLVGLGDVNVLAVDDVDPDEPIRIFVETRWLRPVCEQCETSAVVNDRPVVDLADLHVFGKPARLVWRKYRWVCPDDPCPAGSWTEQEPRIAA
jgi:transposase